MFCRQIQQDELTKQTLSSKFESSTTCANTVEKSHQQTVTSNENSKAPIEQSDEKVTFSGKFNPNHDEC